MAEPITGPRQAPTTCEQKENVIMGQAVSEVGKRSAALAPTFDKGIPAKQPPKSLAMITPAYVGDRAAGIWRIENNRIPVV